jgi:hypothetical protein
MTDLEALRRELQQATAAPPRLLDPLPRKVRVRLWLHGHVDDAAYWLVCHDHCTAAWRLWQLFRMW